MFGLIAAMMAMAVPASSAGMALNIQSAVGSEVLESGLASMWYEAFVAPDGTIEGCTVRATMGDAKAAPKVCSAIIGRKVSPAVGADGQPTYGYYRSALNFSDNLDPIAPDAVAADLALQVQGLSVARARVGVTVSVGADGKVLACEGSAGLARTACEQVKGLDLPVRKAKSGAAVGYLYPMIVEFQQDRG